MSFSPNVHSLEEVRQALMRLQQLLGSSSGGGSGVTDATFITRTPSSTLSDEQALSTLATGILKSTTATGVVSIATPGTDYPALGHTHPLTEITDDGKLAYVDTVEFLTPFFVSATPVAIL